MKKRLLSLLLAVSMLLGSLGVVTAGAADQTDTPVALGSQVNPHYSWLPEPEPLPEAQDLPDGAESEAGYRTATYVSASAAADQLRAAMVSREETVTLYINTGKKWDLSSYSGQTGLNDWFFDNVFYPAFSQDLAKCPYDGDYLEWSWRNASLLAKGSGTKYDFQLSVTYYTTAREEQELAAAVERLAGELKLSALEPYARYTAIYDYITSHVSYDEAGLNTLLYGSEEDKNYHIVTAYGALIEGKAVCQGYASLFYALCRYADLPVRTITSATHAWNIVYLKNRWYNVDATWDSSTASRREWYLLGSERFDTDPLHRSEAEFKTPEFQSAYPISAEDYDPDCPYVDVPRNSYFYNDINQATARGLFVGTGDYMFTPNREMTRGEMVTVLWRLAGQPSRGTDSGFTDVSRSAYYAEPVAWAAENDIVYGYGGGLFGPDDKATREQFVTILCRYAKYLGKDTSAYNDLSGFKDQDQVSGFALRPMQWAVGAGILKGVEVDVLGPGGYTTRGQLAAFIMRFVNYYGI